MYVKHGADTTDAWLRQPIRLNRQYLRGYLIFLNQSLLGKVLPKLSQRSPSARAKRGMWGLEKELSAFVLQDSCQYLLELYTVSFD